jgi:hypothetical protein
VALFKNGIRDGRVDPNKKFRFRTYTDGTLRAMLTERYAIIDNEWYIEQIRETFKGIGGDEPRFVHWRGNADTVVGNLVIPDSITQRDDSDYGGMLSITNSEIGVRRLTLLPSIFRSICTNGCVFGQEFLDKLSQVHKGEIDLKLLSSTIVRSVGQALPRMGDGIEKFLSMKDKKLTTSPSKVIAQLAMDNKLSLGGSGQVAQIAEEFSNHEINSRNLFGIVNALTRAAQKQDPAEHLRMEEIAGRFMDFDDNRWANYNIRANAMDDKMYNKAFGIVTAA